MLIPRYYQKNAKEKFFEYTSNNHGRHPLIVLSTGAGKSMVIAMIIEEMLKWDHTKILILQHSKHLLTQNANELTNLLNDRLLDIGVYSAGLNSRDSRNRILFAGIQSIHDKAWSVAGYRDLILVDECFTEETIIDTLNGSKQIKDIKEGDIVFNAFGFGEVEKTFKKTSNEIYTLRLSNGENINCTGSHRFFTDKGWIEARNMEKGESLFCKKRMSFLQNYFSSSYKNKREWEDLYSTGSVFSETEILLNILFSEILESDGRHENKREDDKQFKKNETQTYSTRWKWKGINRISIFNIKNIREWMESGTTYKNLCRTQKWCLSKLLQSGYRKRKNEDSYRIRWKYSLWKTINKRRKKNEFFEIVRVENISIEKCGSDRIVYDLQVAGHPSYYANGVLVHNCHHISVKSEGSYRKFLDQMIKINPKIVIGGLSATPWRTKGGLLCDSYHKNKIFDDICYEVTIPELINPNHPKNEDKKQYLCPLISPQKAMKSKVDLSNVHVVAGEYNLKEMENSFNKDDLIERTVEEIISYVLDRKKVIIFCAGIDHCETVYNAFIRHGFTADRVHSKRTKEENEIAMTSFSKGQIKFLLNINSLTEGYNVKDIDCIAILRATMSPGLWVQMCGRGLRLHPSKENTLILDFGENCNRLGSIDSIEIKKQKDGTSKAEGVPQKTCPNCESLMALAVMICPDCGYEFPQRDKHEDQASEADIISKWKKPETYDVNYVDYSVHQKIGSPDCLRVKYYVGDLAHFDEFVCPLHTGFAQKKAKRWLDQRLPVERLDEPLYSIEDIVKNKDKIIEPVQIIVDLNGKFPNISGFLFQKIEQQENENVRTEASI